MMIRTRLTAILAAIWMAAGIGRAENPDAFPYFVFTNQQEIGVLGTMEAHAVFGVVSVSGEVLQAPRYSGFRRESSTHALVNLDGEGKCASIDSSGRQLPCDYFERGGQVGQIFERGGLQGLRDEAGRVLLPPEYEQIRNLYPGKTVVVRKEGKEALFNQGSVEFLTGFEWDDLQPLFYEGHTPIKWQCRMGSLLGALDSSGSIVIEPEFQWIKFATEDRAEAWLGEGQVLIDGRGNRVVETVFEWLSPSAGEQSALVRLNGLFGVIDLEDGHWLALPRFERMVPQGEGYKYLKVLQDGKWGLIDRRGDELFPLEYADINVFHDQGVAFSMRRNRWGIMDWEKIILVPDVYHAIYSPGSASGRIAKMKSDSGWGVLRVADWEPIVPPIFEDIRVVNDSECAMRTIQAERDEVLTIFDLNGEELLSGDLGVTKVEDGRFRNGYGRIAAQRGIGLVDCSRMDISTRRGEWSSLASTWMLDTVSRGHYR